VILPSVVAGSMYWLNENGFFNINQVEIVLVDSQSQVNFYSPMVDKLEKQMLAFNGQSLWSLKLSQVIAILNSQKIGRAHV
jgi:cell division protein FtsQ